MNKPQTGYNDVLVIVNQFDLVTNYDLEDVIEDKVRTFLPPPFKPECNLIMHTLDEASSALKEGQYFFTDIKEQEILYELSRKNWQYQKT